MKDLAIAYAMKKKAKKMAEGGEAQASELQEQYKNANSEGKYSPKEMEYLKKLSPKPMAAGGFVEEEMDSGYVDHEEDDVKHNKAAIHEDDFIDRLIAKKMSEGGMVSNDVGVAEADKKPAEYDDLVLRDELEDHYTGKNSGDELGDAQEDEDRHDIVAKIMKSRAKKDKMPRPA